TEVDQLLAADDEVERRKHRQRADRREREQQRLAVVEATEVERAAAVRGVEVRHVQQTVADPVEVATALDTGEPVRERVVEATATVAVEHRRTAGDLQRGRARPG